MIDRIPIDAVGIQERVARICTRSIKKESKLQALDLALRMMDLTTLEGSDSEGKVRQLCNKALRPYTELPDIPPSSGGMRLSESSCISQKYS